LERKEVKTADCTLSMQSEECLHSNSGWRLLNIKIENKFIK